MSELQLTEAIGDTVDLVPAWPSALPSEATSRY